MPWDSWGPSKLHPSELLWFDKLLAVSGLRIIYRSAILAFNPYSVKHDIYRPSPNTDRPERGNVVRTGVALEVADVFHLRNSTYHVPAGPSYRQNPKAQNSRLSGYRPSRLSASPSRTTMGVSRIAMQSRLLTDYVLCSVLAR